MSAVLTKLTRNFVHGCRRWYKDSPAESGVLWDLWPIPIGLWSYGKGGQRGSIIASRVPPRREDGQAGVWSLLAAPANPKLRRLAVVGALGPEATNHTVTPVEEQAHETPSQNCGQQ